jgi:hypothetical protein
MEVKPDGKRLSMGAAIAVVLIKTRLFIILKYGLDTLNSKKNKYCFLKGIKKQKFRQRTHYPAVKNYL